jgi:hypothetical protein
MLIPANNQSDLAGRATNQKPGMIRTTRNGAFIEKQLVAKPYNL